MTDRRDFSQRLVDTGLKTWTHQQVFGRIARQSEFTEYNQLSTIVGSFLGCFYNFRRIAGDIADVKSYIAPTQFSGWQSVTWTWSGGTLFSNARIVWKYASGRKPED